jgi:hypothetical protein
MFSNPKLYIHTNRNSDVSKNVGLPSQRSPQDAWQRTNNLGHVCAHFRYVCSICAFRIRGVFFPWRLVGVPWYWVMFGVLFIWYGCGCSFIIWWYSSLESLRSWITARRQSIILRWLLLLLRTLLVARWGRVLFGQKLWIATLASMSSSLCKCSSSCTLWICKILNLICMQVWAIKLISLNNIKITRQRGDTKHVTKWFLHYPLSKGQSRQQNDIKN